MNEALRLRDIINAHPAQGHHGWTYAVVETAPNDQDLVRIDITGRSPRRPNHRPAASALVRTPQEATKFTEATMDRLGRWADDLEARTP